MTMRPATRSRLPGFSALLVPIAALAVLGVSCGGGDGETAGEARAPGQPAARITLGAYTTPREAYGEILPLFRKAWKEQTGQDLVFEESYLGSGAQSRAICEGFEADLAALSLEADIDRIVQAGLITHDWKDNPTKGMVSSSIVAFAVRKGNPKGIRDWADLAKPGLQLLTPNPRTSGGAMWNVLALLGAARRGFVEGVPAGDEAAAREFLRRVLKNVTVMDKGARESITNFEKGVGDVAITYENEILVGRDRGLDYEMVVPRSTILIENPAALIDASVDKHRTREATAALIAFLRGPEAQEVFARHGLRSVDPQVAAAHAAQYPPVEDQFSIEFFGGWKEAVPAIFSDQGIYSLVINELQK